MFSIRIYDHGATEEERKLIATARAQRKVTLLGRRYAVRRIDIIKEHGKCRTEIDFYDVGVVKP